MSFVVCEQIAYVKLMDVLLSALHVLLIQCTNFRRFSEAGALLFRRETLSISFVNYKRKLQRAASRVRPRESAE